MDSYTIQSILRDLGFKVTLKANTSREVTTHYLSCTLTVIKDRKSLGLLEKFSHSLF